MKFYPNKHINITFSIWQKTLSFSCLIGGYSRELYILFAIQNTKCDMYSRKFIKQPLNTANWNILKSII